MPGIYYKVQDRIEDQNQNDVAMETHLFGVLEVLKQCLFFPSHTLVDVGSSIRETLDLARLATEEAVSQDERLSAAQHSDPPS